MRYIFSYALISTYTDTSVSTTTAPTDSEMTTSPLTTDNDVPATTPSSHLSTAITDPSSTTERPLGNTAAPPSGGTGGSLPVIMGGVVGVLVFVVLLMVAVLVLVVCILTRRRSTDKWTPACEVVSEQQPMEGSQRGVISNGIHSAEAGECVCVHGCRYLNTFNLCKYLILPLLALFLHSESCDCM